MNALPFVNSGDIRAYLRIRPWKVIWMNCSRGRFPITAARSTAQRGDILYDPEREGKSFCGPVVMENVTPQYFAETGRAGFDTSDMNVWGYFQDDDGTMKFDKNMLLFYYECRSASLPDIHCRKLTIHALKGSYAEQ